jgi:3-deoxy-D-manno-octulosonate 8-phosphate phosphatase (KDO 8-P phosphatase)
VDIRKLTKIKAILLDVDGVLTDGSLLVTESGDLLRRMNVHDGYGMQCWMKKGYALIVLTGGRSQGVRNRLTALGPITINDGVEDKYQAFQEWFAQNAYSLENLLYIGDDLPDLKVMQEVGIAVAPPNAVEEVRAIAHWITQKRGGEGCVREVIETILKAKSQWG